MPRDAKNSQSSKTASITPGRLSLVDLPSDILNHLAELIYWSFDLHGPSVRHRELKRLAMVHSSLYKALLPHLWDVSRSYPLQSLRDKLIMYLPPHPLLSNTLALSGLAISPSVSTRTGSRSQPGDPPEVRAARQIHFNRPWNLRRRYESPRIGAA